MRNQRGITLIALVVTIVVLLILAGTSIAMLGGDNGIITNAQDAVAANTEGEVLDKMNVAYNTVKSYVITKSSTLSDWIANDVSSVEEKDSTELTVAKVIAKEILPNEKLEKKGEETTYKAEGDGYTIVYTPTVSETAGKVEITYADKTFSGTTGDGKHYNKITAKITIKSDDVEYERPERQVNQK